MSAATDAFNLRWEIGILRVMAVLIIAAGMMIIAISPAIGLDLAIPELLLCAVAITYFLVSSLMVRQMSDRWLGHMRWLSATAEASFGTIAIWVSAMVKGPEWAATTPMILIYALVIVSCSIRIRPRLTAYCTAVACGQWLLLYYVLLAPMLADANAPATAGAWAAWERAFWIALIGGTSTFATTQLRKTALAGGWQALRRERVRAELSKFLPAEAAEAALAGRAQRGLMDRRDVTALFCDLRDFTGLCERERPDAVMDLLNEFFDQACRAVIANGGQINKFLGDGFLALFDEHDMPHNHAASALRTGTELALIAKRLRDRGGIWAHLSIGIGLDTGPVLVGTVGAEDRHELTAIGKTVNRAARLQALADRSPTRIIVSEACSTMIPQEMALVAIGEVSIKGVAAPMRIYTLAG